MEFFNNLEPVLRTFWFIAIPTSLVFIIQTILTFIGADAHEGIDADFDSNLEGSEAPFQLFSLRNLINFLLGFSWTGISFYNYIESTVLLVLLSFGIGTVFLFLFFFIILQIQKLAEDNSFQYSDTLDKSAEVYLSIPEKKSGKGKIIISVKGSFHELDAMTEGEALASSSMVKVVKIINQNIVLVEKL